MPRERVGEPGAAGTLAGQRVLLDEVLGDQLGQRGAEVVSVEDLVGEALGERLEVVRRASGRGRSVRTWRCSFR